MKASTGKEKVSVSPRAAKKPELEKGKDRVVKVINKTIGRSSKVGKRKNTKTKVAKESDDDEMVEESVEGSVRL